MLNHPPPIPLTQSLIDYLEEKCINLTLEMGIYGGLIMCWYLYPYSVKQQDPISKNYTTCSMLSWITIGNFVEVLEKLEWSFHDKLIRVEISKTTQILPFN